MKTQHVLIIILLMFGLQSCVDEIELDLDSHETTYIVVDAVINDLYDEQVITLKYTAKYDSNTPLPPVSGATVYVGDGDSVYAFSESEPGIYTSVFRGVIGKTYTLTIENNGELYEASSTMYPSFIIDSVKFVDF